MEDDSSDLRANAVRQSSTRIHFPAGNNMGSNRSIRTRPSDGQHVLAGLTPPVRRGSPLNPQNVSQTMDFRRQPWPLDVPFPPSPDPPSRQRRNLSFSHTPNLRLESSLGPDNQLESGAFSDEYELGERNS